MVPFAWMILAVFKTPGEVVAFPPVWFPKEPTFDNIHSLFEALSFARYLANTAFVTVTVTSISLFTSALVGYVLAKMDFWGREALFLAILTTMMIPYPVTLVPSYQLMSWLGWVNDYRALIVPSLYSAFGIFMVRQFMHAVPDELLDAGRVDGASEWYIFLRLVLPLCGPVLSALGIFFFLWQWNSYMWPAIIINNEEMYTLTVGLATMYSMFVTNYARAMAGATISMIPVVIVFLLLQRHFVAGVAITGMKG